MNFGERDSVLQIYFVHKRQIKRTGKNLEAAAARIRPTIADEHYLSGDEVCRMLHVSKRTLQTLRDEKAIPYTSITSVGGKLLYPESGQIGRAHV